MLVGYKLAWADQKGESINNDLTAFIDATALNAGRRGRIMILPCRDANMGWNEVREARARWSLVG